MVSGEWSYPNGTTFKGNFENNKPKFGAPIFNMNEARFINQSGEWFMNLAIEEP